MIILLLRWFFEEGEIIFQTDWLFTTLSKKQKAFLQSESILQRRITYLSTIDFLAGCLLIPAPCINILTA